MLGSLSKKSSPGHFEIIEEMAWLLSLLYLAEDHPDLSLRVLWYVGDMFDIPSDYGDCFVIYQISQIQDRYFSKSKEFSGEIVGVWKMKIKWKFKQDMIMLFSFKDLSDSDDMMLGTWYMPE